MRLDLLQRLLCSVVNVLVVAFAVSVAAMMCRAENPEKPLTYQEARICTSGFPGK